MKLDGYLTKLASEQPTPGGGSAAMVVGAAGSALLAMVARICRAPELTGRADELQSLMLAQREADESAFEAVVAARANKDAMQQALLGAAQAPLHGATLALAGLRLCDDAFALGNAHLVSDIGCAAEFLHAALLASAYNVRINHRYLKDAGAIAQQREALDGCEREGNELLSLARARLTESLRARA